MFISKIKTAWALGLPSLLRVIACRGGVKFGLNPVRRLQAKSPPGPFFKSYEGPVRQTESNEAWREESECFGWFHAPLNGKCPNWHANPFTGVGSLHADQPWWTIPDFDPELGDIKTVWEASRWDWVLLFASRAQAGEEGAITQLNAWLADWTYANPPYLGANWKCGQEASIRVMHVAMAAVMLEQIQNPHPSLLELIQIHLQRIAPTIRYAIAQDNNHGTSEAAALFIGGTWLERVAADSRGRKWAAIGRRWLENRILTLVETDGSFSQYSVNYHRVLLDTLSMVEVWRRQLNLPPFSDNFVTRAVAATDWLAAFVDPETGDVPNIGANDGARLLPICRTDYRDYRPSVQLASVLYSDTTKYPIGEWKASFQSLGVPQPPSRPLQVAKSRLFDKGGYAVLCRDEARAYMRYPRYRFRPSQADALHVDLWVGSRNLLRDGGSYSYADPLGGSYFCGTESHNTVQFDERDQMPRIGRFLFGEWLRTLHRGQLETSGEQVSFSASYKDWQGAKHERELRLSSGQLRVIDRIEGGGKAAVIRWRLDPDEWCLEGNTLSSPTTKIRVTANIDMSRMELVQGQESKYYLRLDDLPVLEIEIALPSVVITDIEWSQKTE